jgi:hypothetical protein
MSRVFRFRWVVVALTLCVAACTVNDNPHPMQTGGTTAGSGGATGGAGGASTCSSGATITCSCSAGGPGTKNCIGNDVYGPCNCGSAGSGAGATGGNVGQAGGGGFPQGGFGDLGTPGAHKLTYEFKPLPYQPAHELNMPSSPKFGAFEEYGPQIAVWIGTAAPDGSLPIARDTLVSHFVTSILVTARTASFGIGNRPGVGKWVSSPLFPYGPRDNVLPIWAWAHNHTYPALILQDGNNSTFGFHESFSSDENYYCRPLMKSEVDSVVDSMTCPSRNFHSDKGKDDPGGRTSLYPPRHDVTADMCGTHDAPACTQLMARDDVAAVSAATPDPTATTPYKGTWFVPQNLPDGAYWIYVEVNKQYDQDAPTCNHPGCPMADPAHGIPTADEWQRGFGCPSYAPFCDPATGFCARHASTYDCSLATYGIGANIGQPSVLWAVRVNIDGSVMHVSTVDQYIGYGDWDSPQGNVNTPDATISQTPGSGAGRLGEVTDGDGTWRVRVTSKP